jgi:VCBS repeat-containing protein
MAPSPRLVSHVLAGFRRCFRVFTNLFNGSLGSRPRRRTGRVPVRLEVFRYEDILAPNNLLAYLEPASWDAPLLAPAAPDSPPGEPAMPANNHASPVESAIDPAPVQFGPTSPAPPDQAATTLKTSPATDQPVRADASFTFAVTLPELQAADGLQALVGTGIGHAAGKRAAAADTPSASQAGGSTGPAASPADFAADPFSGQLPATAPLSGAAAAAGPGPLVSGAAPALPAAAPAAPAAVDSPASPAALLGSQALTFEQNVGQASAPAQFIARGPGYSLQLSPQRATLNVRQNPAGADPSAAVTGTVVRMDFPGANPAALLSGVGELPGKVNYLIGSDPSSWHTDVPTFSRVHYASVWQGVDLEFYGNAQDQLEYDFLVKPGADAGQIHLAFQGQASLDVDAQGNLLMHTAYGDLLQPAPTLYQLAGGVRQAVAGGYTLGPAGQVAFQVGAYDHGRELVIDPVMSYSTYAGGSADEQGLALAVDGTKAAYLAGSTASTNLPVTSGSYQQTSGGQTDAFVAKYSASSSLVYMSYLGGSSNDSALGDYVDASGNLYVTGTTSSSNFPTTSGAYATSLSGSSDAFLTKLNSSGSSLIFSTYFGGAGTASESGRAVRPDGNGNAIIVGDTASSSLPTFKPFKSTYQGGTSDAFIAQFNSSGTALLCSSYLGGSGADTAYAVSLIASSFIVAGGTSSSGIASSGAYQAMLNGSTDGFVANLTLPPSGNLMQNSFTYYGGAGDETIYGLATDATFYYVTGKTTSSSTLPTTTNAYSRSLSGTEDAFVAKLTSNSLFYGSYLGGTGTEEGYGIAYQGNNNVFVTGLTTSADFPLQSAVQTASAGGNEAFVTELPVGNSGGAPIFSTYLGGNLDDQGNAIALDSINEIYVAGTTSSTNFPTQLPAQAANRGGSDAFVTRLGPLPTATDDSYTVVHDHVLTVSAPGVLGNDTDPVGLTLSAVQVGNAQHGNVNLGADGSFTFTPDAGFTGTASFQYYATDGGRVSNTATVTISVTNNAPVAQSDSYGVQPNTARAIPALIGVLSNDSDADGDNLTASYVTGTGPSHGTLNNTFAPDGSFTYTPNAGYTGTDTFQYRASDGIASSTATVTLTIHATNSAPAAVNDSYTVLHGHTLTVNPKGVLANDTDADNDPLTAVLVSSTTHGTLTLNSNGSFTYASSASYTGTDTFTYQANDGLANSGTATVTITVTDPNTPTAAADTYSTPHNVALNVAAAGVLANDSDADGDPLTAVLVSGTGPSHGTLTLNSDGSFLYTPGPAATKALSPLGFGARNLRPSRTPGGA